MNSSKGTLGLMATPPLRWPPQAFVCGAPPLGMVPALLVHWGGGPTL